LGGCTAHESSADARASGDRATAGPELLGPLARQAGLAAVVQEFALGDSNDYRVPDGGLHRAGASGVWHHTAALVIEIVSPGDETWNKLSFYAAHQVDELLIVDPDKRTVTWLALTSRGYEPIDQSRLIGLGPAQLARQLAWPATGR
jgi:Uma2 family endonuclease